MNKRKATFTAKVVIELSDGTTEDITLETVEKLITTKHCTIEFIGYVLTHDQEPVFLIREKDA